MNNSDKEIPAGEEALEYASSVSSEPKKPDSGHDPYRALRYRDFRLLLSGTFIAALGEQMVNVAIGWELYDRTHSPLALGIVGLVLVIPVILFSLPAGTVADRFSRKHIVFVAQSAMALAFLGLMVLSLTRGPLVLFYGCLLLVGSAVAFSSPASTTLLPQTVPEEIFEQAARWESTSWQLAAVLGPSLGGLLIALLHSAAPVYGLNVGIALLVACFMLLLRGRGQQVIRRGEQTTVGVLLEGVRFLGKTQVILAAITLDLFAVLFGGATALLPIYARDILHVGPSGLGWMLAAPSIGAVCVAFLIAHVPPFKKAGRTLLLVVAGFGVATGIFGLSRVFWLSFLMLCLLGGLDNVSVVIRSTLLLTRTPDNMRGRVASVNTLFVSMSNQLGGFESGLAAQFFGPVIAVTGGGIGTLVVVALVAMFWPEMRRLGRLSEREK